MERELVDWFYVFIEEEHKHHHFMLNLLHRGEESMSK